MRQTTGAVLSWLAGAGGVTSLLGSHLGDSRFCASEQSCGAQMRSSISPWVSSVGCLVTSPNCRDTEAKQGKSRLKHALRAVLTSHFTSSPPEVGQGLARLLGHPWLQGSGVGALCCCPEGRHWGGGHRGGEGGLNLEPWLCSVLPGWSRSFLGASSPGRARVPCLLTDTPDETFGTHSAQVLECFAPAGVGLAAGAAQQCPAAAAAPRPRCFWPLPVAHPAAL